MHIAVNTRLLLSGRLEGIGRVAHELLQRLPGQLPQARFSFLFDRPHDRQFIYSPAISAVELFPPARHPFLYLAWFEGRVAQWLNRQRPDVFFSPDAYLSLRARVPQVPLFHDLAFEHFPHDIDRLHRWHYRTFFPRYAHQATRILTVSEATRQDLISTYGTPPDRIVVAPNACSSVFGPSSSEVQAACRARFSGGQPFFLSVGAIQPRKNLTLLLRAFDRFKSETGHPARLLLVGRKAWRYGEVERIYAGLTHRADVEFTGFVSDAELNVLYGSSLALCYVSRYEGFGLPLLEAMEAETAVVASDIAALREVGGDAARYVGVDDVSGLASVLAQLAVDAGLRASLIERGRQQRQRFSWEGSAAVVARVLAEAAARVRRRGQPGPSV